MSTLKSSAEDLTLNADGSGNDIKFQSNAVEKGSLTDGGVWIGSTFEPTGDTAASDNAAIGYTSVEGLILTGQGSTDDVTIKNDADTTVLNVATGSSDIEVSAGDLIFGTAGKGVCLGVTSNTDANTLDDYEEGTYVPTMTGSTSGSLSAASVNTLSYTKVGRLVTVTGKITVTADNSLNGTIRWTLPFTAAAQSQKEFDVAGTVMIRSGGTEIPNNQIFNIGGGGTNGYIMFLEDTGNSENVGHAQSDASFDVWFGYTYCAA